MGTSKPYGGPGDGPPLLPNWAQGDGAPPLPPPKKPPEENEEPESLPTPAQGTDSESPTSQVPETRPWRVAKIAMSRLVASGGRENIQKATRGYVRAQGGSVSAARAAKAGRSATTRVVGFLSNVANRGVGEALRALGLANVLGQPVETVLAAIVNALAPNGASLDDIAARRTIDEALVVVFERYEVLDGGIERLNAMDADVVQEAFRVSTAEFIFQRLMLDLGKRIDERSMTDREARKLELEVKAYVVEAVKLDLRGKDVLTTNWAAPENQRIVEKIYQEAYRFLEA